MDEAAHIAPLEGCLCCHHQGVITLSEGRKILGFGSDFPIIRCEHCGSTASLDFDPGQPDQWRIRYRRVNPSPEYYYVALYLGEAGWLSAEDALAISTNGFVQRERMRQTKAGILTWLHPRPIDPPPPLMSPRERVYLTLKGVTLQEAPPSGLLVRPDQGAILDSGKFYVTDQKLHLLGQRRDWSHHLSDIERVDYDDHAWVILLDSAEEPRQYRGLNSSDQLDAQLVATIVKALRKM